MLAVISDTASATAVLLAQGDTMRLPSVMTAELAPTLGWSGRICAWRRPPKSVVLVSMSCSNSVAVSSRVPLFGHLAHLGRESSGFRQIATNSLLNRVSRV